jgi:hypothetical protein
MANPNIATHLPIEVVSTTSGNQESIQGFQEAASQTFKPGTPVELNSSGNVIAWDGTTLTDIILGVSLLQGYNYATAGAGASPDFGSIGFPGGTPTFGTVPNQSAAVNLLHGSPFATGLSVVALANQDTIFEAMTDASTGSTFAPTIANIGKQYGLTADSNGFWYVDLGKSTAGTNTVLTIESINPADLVAGSSTTGVNNARVRFKFLAAATLAL